MSEVCGVTNIDKKSKVAEAVPARWAIAGSKKVFIMSPETVISVNGTVEAREMELSPPDASWCSKDTKAMAKRKKGAGWMSDHTPVGVQICLASGSALPAVPWPLQQDAATDHARAVLEQMTFAQAMCYKAVVLQACAL